MSRPLFVITGPGRSGTKLAARFLTAVGILTGHEARFNAEWPNGPVNELGDSSWMASLILSADHQNPLRRPPVAALVRRPEACVRSFTAIGFYTDAAISWNKCHSVVRAHTPQVYDWERPADRALAHWCETTERSLGLAEHVWHLEALDASSLMGLATWATDHAFLPRPQKVTVERVWAEMREVNQNPLEHDRRTWGETYFGWMEHPLELRGRAAEIAWRAGYEEDAR